MTGFGVTLLAETHSELSREHPIRQLGENKPQPRVNARSQMAPYWISLSKKSHPTAPVQSGVLLIRVWERNENDNSEDR